MHKNLDIEKLSNLSRIAMTPEEISSISDEISAILDYVGQIDKAISNEVLEIDYPIVNVLREDNKPHLPGLHTDKILDEFPKKEGNYLRVKKILG